MNTVEPNWKKIIDDLSERAKELNCLYQIEEILKDSEAEPEAVIGRMLAVIPSGWQYPDRCRARINFLGKEYVSDGFQPTEWLQSAEVSVEDQKVGSIEVFYIERADFLPEEQKLLNTIADRFSHFLFQRELRRAVKEWDQVRTGLPEGKKMWKIIVELLEKTDRRLFERIVRKLLNYLCWIGIDEARRLLAYYTQQNGVREAEGESVFEANRPSLKVGGGISSRLAHQVFGIAARYMSDEEIFEQVQKWVRENGWGSWCKPWKTWTPR